MHSREVAGRQRNTLATKSNGESCQRFLGLRRYFCKLEKPPHIYIAARKIGEKHQPNILDALELVGSFEVVGANEP